MKKFKIFASLLLIGAITASCNDYLDVNENPNQIHEDVLSPQLVFPGAVSQIYRTQAGTMMQFGNVMMNSWAGNSYVFGSPFAKEYTLSAVDNSFYNGIWNGIYLGVNNFAYIENISNTDHKYDNYVAMAKIMKAYYLQTIVDLYGDIPYSEAFRGQENLTPKYDNDETVYQSLYKNLEEATALIQAENPAALKPSADDIVFQGNMTSWNSFANSVKLRMLIRMTKVTGSMATFRDQKLAALSSAINSGQSFITTDVIENPGYSPSSDDNMNPFFLTWRINSAGTAPQNYSLITVSEHMAVSLNGNPNSFTQSYYQKFNALPDPRRSRLFTAISYTGLPSGSLKGVRQGATPGQPGAPSDVTTVSKLANGNFSGAAALSLTSGNRGGVVMSLAESKFLQAEAALRYPSLFSGAQTAFNAGITASAVWVGLSATSMTSYITNANTRPGLGWTGTDAQKLEAIMTQKWIALTNVNPTEMYIEYNRTGLPITPLATSAAMPNKPYRLIYPVSEYVGNSANVPNISSADAFTKNATTPFWNQN